MLEREMQFLLDGLAEMVAQGWNECVIFEPRCRGCGEPGVEYCLMCVWFDLQGMDSSRWHA